MDRYLLKNTIIVILLLVNGFLLGALATRATSERSASRQAKEQLVELFAADNLSLDIDVISDQTPPPARTLARSNTLEVSAARFFLGETLTQEDQGGGTYTLSGSAGTARFRSNGSFEVDCAPLSDAEKLCTEFCKEFSYQEPVFLLDESGSGTGTAVSTHNKLPVFNAVVTFTLEDGTLIRVSGTLMPKESIVSAGAQEPLSAMAALTAFQNMRRETFAVVSAVTEMYPCYELQSSTSSAITLVPAWCIATDITDYYVNCTTGAITSR